ncbi:hypothetical protein N656DRAFT_831967 [Canariomyces notabilis]|uniref:Uncharacterized protein n=1 Tax=Canariomyces notabilis TaxID=2074819 RepID=A0AAN6QEY0_9PEZI|nr:hypothetical protein N656DRAFT_831967 [Canariomyces arenarius]
MAAAWYCGAYSIIMALIGGNPVPKFTVWQCIVLAALAYTAFVWAKSRSLPQRQAERTTRGLVNPYVQLSQDGSTAMYFKIQPGSLSYRLQDLSHAQLRGYDLGRGVYALFLAAGEGSSESSAVPGQLRRGDDKIAHAHLKDASIRLVWYADEDVETEKTPIPKGVVLIHTSPKEEKAVLLDAILQSSIRP